MTRFSVPRKWLWPILAGLVLLVAIGGYALVASRGGVSGLAGFEPVGSSSGTTQDGGDQTPATGGVTEPGSSGGTVAKGGKGSFYVKILWWNDTKTRGPKNVIVTWDGGSWSPDATLKSDVTTIGPFPVGKKLNLTVYPDGKSRPGRVVPFTIRASMLSESDRDGIHIELRDDNLRVLGNAVQNFERNYARK